MHGRFARLADRRARARSSRGATTTACSACTSTPSPTGREDRVRRQPALASGDRGRQLHPRHARGACSRRRPASTRSSRSRRRACAGPARIREALDGLDVELRTWPLPASHALRTAWSIAGHPAAERLLGPFDVLHFTDWMYPPQRAGVRATTIHDLVPLRFPEWTTERTRAMHGRKYANAARTCDVIFVNSAFTGARRDRAARRRSRRGSASRRRASRTCSRPTGRRPTSGAPYILTVGDARAAQEPAGARRGAPAPRRRHPARGRGRRGLGRAAGARRPARAPARLRLRRGARAALPRRRGRRLPLAVRGLRDADRRGDGVRHAGRRLVPRRRWTRRRATSPCAPTRTIRRRSRRRSSEAIARARAARRRPGIEHAARFTWRAAGEAMLAGYEARAVKVGLDVAPLAQTGAGTARVVQGLSRRARGQAGARGRAGSASAAAGARRPSPATSRGTRSGIARAARTARRAPLHDDARAAARARCPSSSPCTICALLRHPEAFPPWHRHTGRVALRHGVRRADAVVAVSAFTRDELVELLGVPAERIRVVPNGVEPVFTPDGPCGGRRLRARRRHARAAQEPRPRGRGGPARGRRAAGRRGAGLGRGRGSRLGRPRRRRGARGALPRRALPRLPVALRGLRAAGARGDGVRDAGRDDARRRDGGGGGRRGGARRPARPGRDRGRDRARPRPGATSCAASGSSARAAFTWAHAADLVEALWRELA